MTEIGKIDRDAILAQCAPSLAKAKWAGDSDILPDGVDVDILAVDPAGCASLHHGFAGGLSGRTACWIRWWEYDRADFRSCDLADLEMADEDFARLSALRSGPSDAASSSMCHNSGGVVVPDGYCPNVNFVSSDSPATPDDVAMKLFDALKVNMQPGGFVIGPVGECSIVGDIDLRAVIAALGGS